MNDRLQQSFDRAQRAYDRQMPPEDTCIDCPDCEDGESQVSLCCGAEVINEFCMDCHEHTEYAKCQTCDGTGLVEPPKHEKEYEPDPTDD